MFLVQSTASQEILLGPFVDSTDGNTAETGLTIANTDIKLWKSGATTLANKNSGGATHISGGNYYAVLDATDTDTLGQLEVVVHVSGALPVLRRFFVVTSAQYTLLTAATGDAFARLGAPAGASVSADVAAVKAQTAAIETDTQDIQGRIPSALVSGRIDASVGAMAANVMTAAAAAADLTTELQSGLATAAALATVDTVVDAIQVTTDKLDDTLEDDAGTYRFTTNALEQAPAGGSGASAEDVWTYGSRVLTAGTNIALAKGTGVTGFNDLAAGDVRTAVGLASADLDTQLAKLDTIDDFLDTEVAAIKAKTDNLPSDPADASVIAGRFDTLDTSVADLPTNSELTTALAAADDAVLAAINALNDLSAAEVNAEVVDALATDTYAEPGAVPAATATLAAKIGWLAALARNRMTQTSTTLILRNDANNADVATSTVSDDGTTTVRGEWA